MRPLIRLGLLGLCLATAAHAEERACAPRGDDGEAAARAELLERLTPLLDQPLLGVGIRCDSEDCGGEERTRLLRRVTRLQRGLPLRPQDVVEARERLLRSGQFRSVEVRLRTPGVGAYVDFVGQEVVVITDLRIEYDALESRMYPRQFRSEIRKRLCFKRGGAFPPLPAGGFTPRDQAAIDEQKARIADLYRRQGYEGTTVEIIPRYQGPDQKTVKVTIKITEGQQPEIGQVLLKGNKVFSYARIVSELPTGERVDFWRELFGAFGVGRYAERLFKEQLRALELMYRNEGYLTARVRHEGELTDAKKRVWPMVRIQEGPLVTVDFVGNDSIGSEDLRSVLTFREAGSFDETEIESSTLAIRRAYQELARYYVEVDHRIERTGPGRVRLIFTINEGPRVYLRSVSLLGSRHISVGELLDTMETRGVAPNGVINSFAASAGVLQDNRIINDLIALRDLYYERGFLGVRFRCANPEVDLATWTSARLLQMKGGAEAMGPMVDPSYFQGRFDLWTADPINHRCFLVEPDADLRLVRLHLELTEGAQTTVDRVDIGPLMAGMDADTREEAHALLETLGFQDDIRNPIKGAGLNPKKIQAVRAFLLRYFQRQGYLGSRVVPVCFRESGGAEGRSDCTTARLYGAHVSSLRFEVEPGPRTEVDGVLVRGNLETRDYIIDRELLMTEGGPLGTEELFRSQANLRSLGLFDAVSVTDLGSTESSTRYAHANPTTVKVTVEEGRYHLVDGLMGLQIASAPLDTDELPVLYTLGATWRHRNFLGRAVEVGLGGTLANSLDTAFDFEGDYSAWEVGPFFKDRRLFGTRLDLSAEATLNQGRTEQGDAYQQAFGTTLVFGYDFYNMSYPAEWGRGLRTTWTLEYDLERRRGLTRVGERPSFGTLEDYITLSPAIIWERRDNALHPTRGSFVTFSTELVSNTLSTQPDISYKATATGQKVFSFFDRRLILVPTLRLGAVLTDRIEANLPSDFLFKAGGDSVSLPVRGYADASIEACRARDDREPEYCQDVFAEGDDDQDFPFTVGGKAMAVGSFEVRWPTFLVEDFWFTAFADAGLIAQDWTVLARGWEDHVFPSVGGGLRWLVTGQIPLRFDVGVPLRATPFSAQEPRFHFNIFYTL